MKPLTKIMWRNIRDSMGRFIAIILIILLGVSIFAGVKTTGPALNDSLNKTVGGLNLSDIQIMSTTGFNNQDVKLAKKVAGAQVTAQKFKFGTDSMGTVVSFYGINSGQPKINQFALRSGRMPANDHEIVLDNRAKTQYKYKLNQQVKFSKNSKLANSKYKIVGFADSPLYIDNASRGSANIGDGSVGYFAFIKNNQLNLNTNTLLNIRFSGLQKLNPYSASYKDKVNARVKTLKAIFKNRAGQRSTQLAFSSRKKINLAINKINQAQSQLPKGTNLPQVVSTQKKLAVQKQKLFSLRKSVLSQTKTTYTFQTRNDLPGFSDFGQSSDRIAAIANVFPVFFFLIAALITFTTITRMVEEDRMHIGTFKAFGYSNFSIAKIYLNYSLIAGILGIILGVISGTASIPRIVLSLYKDAIPLKPVIQYQWGPIVIVTIMSLISTVEAALIVVMNQLRDRPAELMRPRSPKSAKRILLERITPLWSRMSFSQKVSFRNLFRYKSRMLMTIIGVAGGTALIMTGYGIKDSIGGSSDLQYGKIVKYQAIAKVANDKNPDTISLKLKNNPEVKKTAPIISSTASVANGGKQVNDINVLATKNDNGLKGFVDLRDYQSKKPLKFKSNQVIITQKLASSTNTKVGDKVNIKLSNNKSGRARVSGIAQNYISDYVYMKNPTYQKVFNQKPNANTLLLRLKNQNQSQRSRFAKSLISKGDILGISFVADQEQTVSSMSSKLNPVVFIFILLSALLSFIVLYNLTNINVSERIRELATIKVLGFYDNEVTMYIVRENIVMTIVGIIFGYAGGNILTAYILHQAETSQVVFPLIIHPLGYVVATTLMVAFTIIVMIITHYRLKVIDMIGALKEE